MDVLLLTNQVISMLKAGRFEELRCLFLPRLRSMVLPSLISRAWCNAVRANFDEASVEVLDIGEIRAGVVDARVLFSSPNSHAMLLLSFTPEGALTSLRIYPNDGTKIRRFWHPPDYVHSEGFEEIECEVGDASLKTGATLSLPKVSGRRPGVLVMPGSGPVDRDGTVDGLKPLKDIAWGLASSGIAVLRFDKITHSNIKIMRHTEGLTVGDEYLHFADRGLANLRMHERVDPKRLFVLGHSFGGTLTPRVALRHPELAGLVILAGAALPIHWTLVRQIRHLSAANASTLDASLIDSLVAQARLVDSPELNASTESAALPMGLPASYWLDLRDYKAAEVAATLPHPMLILQGGRDYQSTLADDFLEWQTTLSHRADVDFRVFPDDDHLFMSSVSSANDGDEPANVDEGVVRACADWIKGKAAN